MADPVRNGIVHVRGPEGQTVVVAMLSQNELDVAEDGTGCSLFCSIFVFTFAVAFGIIGIVFWSVGLTIGIYFFITAGVCLLITVCFCQHLKSAHRSMVEKYMQRNES